MYVSAGTSHQVTTHLIQKVPRQLHARINMKAFQCTGSRVAFFFTFLLLLEYSLGV